MSKTVTISPLTRIEGHLAVHTETEPLPGGGARVTAAHCEGEMFRGIEQILRGRSPLDAQQITQRICGVCPIAHGIASVRAQEAAYGIVPGRNGRLLQNLIFAGNFIQSHVLHFYHLAALDFVDVTAVLQYRGRDRTLVGLRDWVKAALDRGDIFPAAPFLPRWEAAYVPDIDVNLALLAHYVEALDVRTAAHEMAAVFGAKLPHSTALVPGGVTQVPTLERILTYRTRLERIAAFVEDVYLPDVITTAGAFPHLWNAGVGHGNLLAYGAFELDEAGTRFFPPGVVVGGRWQPLDPDAIAEDVGHSRFDSPSHLHPVRGETHPAAHKPGAYSWIKAPRYRGQAMEVGPAARVLVGFHHPEGHWIRGEVAPLLQRLGVAPRQLESVLGRHLCRALEARWLARQAAVWLDDLELGGAPAQRFDLPSAGRGMGLTEAPRGALGHWLTLEEGKIGRYQCVVPTTWNCSPRSDDGQPGAVEKALEDTVIEDPTQPMEPARIVRSFDPCLACAVH